jgi:hypothetical protein
VSISIEVVRPDDLLIARFEFHGLLLDAGESTPQLVREPGATKAVLVVHLPPQSFGEPAFDAPVTENLRGPTPILQSTPARLCFEVPSSIERLPLTLDTLLGWDKFDAIRASQISRPPEAAETSIELPYRLILSTYHEAQWQHVSALPQLPSGTAELWSSRLKHPFFGRDVVTVAWSPDLVEEFRVFRLALDGASRYALASSATESLAVQRLALTPLGGELQIAHARDPDSSSPGLMEWHHLLMLGRDQRVRTAKRGLMFPFQHRATLISFTERVFSRGAALLEQQELIVINEAERQYDSRAWPFQSIRILPEFAKLRIEVGQRDVVVPVIATDKAGQEHRFRMPMRFVTPNADDQITQDELKKAKDAYNGAANEVLGDGQHLAFVGPENGTQDAATYPTLAFGIDGALTPELSTGFLPELRDASVGLEALQEITGSVRERVTIAYNVGYLRSGFLTGDKVRHFADIRTKTSVRLPASLFGGVAAPTFDRLDALTLDKGVTVASATGLLDPTAFGGQLLGALPLRVSPTNGSLPTIAVIQTAGAVRQLSFEWKAMLEGKLAPALDLSGNIQLGGPSPSPSTLNGTLSNYTVSLAEVVAVTFQSLSFTRKAGEPVLIHDVRANFQFLGDLEFLQQIGRKFAEFAPGGPAGTKVAVSPQAITATFAMTLPDIPMGQFTLLNLALSATLELRFADAALLTLALSSRRDPFLVSYNGLGGGGFFELQVDVKGATSTIEAAIELGAVAEVNFVVAKGSAQILIGIYLSIEQAISKLSGFVRIHGAVEVLGLVSVSLDVMLSLSYSQGVATGRVDVLLVIQVLGFSKSVSFSVERSFDSGLGREVAHKPERGLHFRDGLTLPQWKSYCDAFAA